MRNQFWQNIHKGDRTDCGTNSATVETCIVRSDSGRSLRNIHSRSARDIPGSDNDVSMASSGLTVSVI
jgi:hypothetical protein